jgi:hypothetical protein
MKRLVQAARLSVLCLALAHCDADDGEDPGLLGGARDAGYDAAMDGFTTQPAIDATVALAKARVALRVASTGGAVASENKFRGGAAVLESLRYYISSLQICESIEVQGSGFGNPRGCLQLFERGLGSLSYDAFGDWRTLAEIARGSDEGYVDLMSAPSRAGLARDTELTSADARKYRYGIITWALPVKLRGSIPFLDGTTLYTHDGVTSYETIGADDFRAYYTAASSPLDRGPAEDAVVLLGNGGNWFKFQTPLVITAEDVAARRAFVLDLVFNPEGLVAGYEGGHAYGNLSQRSASGAHEYDVTVPMLDLAPVPHRADQRVVRESYRGAMTLGGNTFDLRIELYSIEGDESGSVYGADIKTLVTSASTGAPPSVVKVAFVDRAADGALAFSAHKHIPVITGMRRQSDVGNSTTVAVRCGTHGDRDAAEGAAALIVDRCPSQTLDVNLTLASRDYVEGSIPVSSMPDAGGGVSMDAASPLDAP